MNIPITTCSFHQVAKRRNYYSLNAKSRKCLTCEPAWCYDEKHAAGKPFHNLNMISLLHLHDYFIRHGSSCGRGVLVYQGAQEQRW